MTYDQPHTANDDASAAAAAATTVRNMNQANDPAGEHAGSTSQPTRVYDTSFRVGVLVPRPLPGVQISQHNGPHTPYVCVVVHGADCCVWDRPRL